MPPRAASTLAVDGSLRVSYRLTRDDGRKLPFGIARAAEIFFAAGATEVYPQIRGMPVIKPGGVADFEATDPAAAGAAARGVPPDGHGADVGRPDGSASTGTDGSVHGTEGLYVADASLLPTSLGVNPMMTISAMAAHVARGLAAKLTG